MKVYQLIGSGVSQLDGEPRIFPSRFVHTSSEGADAERDDFVVRLCEPSDWNLDCLEPDSMKIRKMAFELV